MLSELAGLVLPRAAVPRPAPDSVGPLHEGS